MQIILISGLDRTGKSIIGEFVSEFHFKKIELGDIVRNLCNEENFKLGISEYYETNKSEIEKIILKKINLETESLNASYKGVALIGARSETLKKSIEYKFSNRIILFVSSAFDLRYERYLNNKNNRPLEAIKSIKDFKDNDEKQYKWGLKKYQEDANYLIANDGDLNVLKTQIQNLMKKIII